MFLLIPINISYHLNTHHEKISCFAPNGSTLAVYSQKTDLVTVRPKKGQKMVFEAAYKQHVAKFHKGKEKHNVYEILSGPYMGYYHLVNAGRSFADFDNPR